MACIVHGVAKSQMRLNNSLFHFLFFKYTYPLLLESPSYPPPPPTAPTNPTPLVVTEHQVELPVSYSNFPLAIYFTYGNICTSMLLSQFVPLSPFPVVSTSLFSMSTSLFLPCKQVHQYHFSKFHICALIYNICFSLYWVSLISCWFCHKNVGQKLNQYKQSN